MCSNAGKTVGTGSAMDLEEKRCMDVVEEAGLRGEAAAWVGLGEVHQQ